MNIYFLLSDAKSVAAQRSPLPFGEVSVRSAPLRMARVSLAPIIWGDDNSEPKHNCGRTSVAARTQLGIEAGSHQLLALLRSGQQ